MSKEAQPEILITDVAERVVDRKLYAESKKGEWMAFDYDLEKIGPGRGIVCDGTDPGLVTVRLGAVGYCRISLITKCEPVLAKLSGDRSFSLCEPVFEKGWRHDYTWYRAEELLWKEADVTGQDLIIDGE